MAQKEHEFVNTDSIVFGANPANPMSHHICEKGIYRRTTGRELQRAYQRAAIRAQRAEMKSATPRCKNHRGF
jgi:hypothetical protein|tara:strand:- start:323 stop:538 length:216 start_codon:yes stop_codon:yes gene_type:complete